MILQDGKKNIPKSKTNNNYKQQHTKSTKTKQAAQGCEVLSFIQQLPHVNKPSNAAIEDEGQMEAVGIQAKFPQPGGNRAIQKDLNYLL